MKAIDVVVYTKTFLNVPFRHAGRSREIGVDCSGLAVLVFNHFNAEIPDDINYSMWDGFAELSRIMLRKFSVVKDGTIKLADVIVFRSPEESIYNHIGIVTEINDDGSVKFFHSSNAHAYGKVAEEKYSGLWRKRTSGIYRFKGIEH